MSAPSSAAALVFGEIPRWVQWFRFLGPLVTVAGIVALMLGPDARVAGNIVFWVGAVTSGVTEVAVYLRQRRRVWVVDTGSGFTLYEPAGATEVADEDVESISLWDTSIYSNGEFKGILRNVRLWLRNRPEQVRMTYRITVKQPEQITELLERLLDRLLQQGEERLDQGGQVEGEGWSLERAGLKYQEGDSPVLLPLERISAVHVVKDEVCIWRKGEEAAAIRFPIQSRNSHILVALLAKQLPEDEPEDQADGEGLGRLMFEIPLGLKTGGMVGLLFVSVGAAVVVAFYSLVLAILLFLVVVPTSILVWWLDRGRTFRVCSHGVRLHGRRRVNQLRYDQLSSFTYSATRNYYNGAYTGTNLRLEFHPRPETPGTTLVFNHFYKNEDEHFDALRDHVSSILASRMALELEETGQTQWTPDVVFCTEGLKYRPSGWIGKKQEWRSLPWDRLANFNLVEGVLHIWEAGNDKSVIREEAGAANLFPGLLLFATLVSPEEPPPQPQLQKTATAAEGDPDEHKLRV